MKSRILTAIMATAILTGCSTNPKPVLESRVAELPNYYKKYECIFAYKEGTENSPDKLEVRTKNNELFEVFEDYNRNGIIGDDIRDAYTSILLEVNKVTKEKPAFAAFKKCGIDSEYGPMLRDDPANCSTTSKFLQDQTSTYQQIRNHLSQKTQPK